MTRLVGSVLAAVFAASCGLVDPDITNFELEIPPKEVTIDSEQWQLSDEGSLPAVSCSGAEGICAGAVEAYCGNPAVCFGSCDGENCRVTILVSLWNELNLQEEVPELSEIDNRPLASVSIDRISYSITENTFNVDTPGFGVYLAPQGVMAPGDAQAEHIGNIAPVVSQETFEARDVELTPDGREALRRYMREFTTPFNLIVGGAIELSAGDLIPRGKLVAVVQIDAHAGL